MPELPEVETIKNDLKKKILRQKIERVEIRDRKIVKSKAKDFVEILEKSYFSDLERTGKLLIFRLAAAKEEFFLLLHLKMTGQLIYQRGREIVAGGHSLKKEEASFASLPDKRTRLIFYLGNGARLFFNDLRRFGYAKIVTAEELAKVKGEYGLEPLTKNFTLENFQKVLFPSGSGRAGNIKAVLMKQKLIAGIGNIYADEILFQAKVNPSRPVKTLTAEEIKEIFRAIDIILKKAIKYRGTTFNNYLDGEGKKGNFMKFLKVYGRKNELCPDCRRAKIIQKKIAGRGTHFCPVCQK